jgi:WD40 repeat protein
MEADVEDLVVGDYNGIIWYYSIEWPSEAEPASSSWEGAMILLAKVAAHTAQICGLTWSPDDLFLATGGDDNRCLLFDLEDLIPTGQRRDAFTSAGRCHHLVPRHQPTSAYLTSRTRSRLDRILISNEASNSAPGSVTPTTNGNTPTILGELGLVLYGPAFTNVIPYNRQKFRLHHSAAVKAIAFAPWQHTLLATGGGVKDGKIHFFHAPTGIPLATISVHAQVTSLIWSSTKREIAVTFGYAQPEHSVRIAVFAWPSCVQVLAIPWTFHLNSVVDPGDDEQRSDPGRAIWAVSYPAGPNTFSHSRNRGNVPEDLHWSFELGSVAGNLEDDTRDVVDVSSIIHGLGEEDHDMLPVLQGEGKIWNARTTVEGSIIVAASDETIRFYEIWSGKTKRVLKSSGLLGGSDILEELEGLDKPGKEIIR